MHALLHLDAPALVASLASRKEWLQQIAGSGWTVAGKRGRAAAAAARAGDVLAHWREGNPISDWQQHREAEAAELARQQEQEQAEMGLDGWDSSIWQPQLGGGAAGAADVFGMESVLAGGVNSLDAAWIWEILLLPAESGTMLFYLQGKP